MTSACLIPSQPSPNIGEGFLRRGVTGSLGFEGAPGRDRDRESRHRELFVCNENRTLRSDLDDVSSRLKLLSFPVRQHERMLGADRLRQR